MLLTTTMQNKVIVYSLLIIHSHSLVSKRIRAATNDYLVCWLCSWLIAHQGVANLHTEEAGATKYCIFAWKNNLNN